MNGPLSDRRPVGFATTAWTTVLHAAGEGVQSQQALESLCQAYWYPLYAYLRRRGQAHQDAEDAVQAFLAWLLESGTLGRADPSRGKFRGFLVAAMQQFLARRHEYDSAAKRRPARPLLSIDSSDGARRFQLEPSHQVTPERQYEYAWALSIVERAMQRLKGEWEQAGKQDRFEALKSSLTGQSDESGRQVAQRLGLSEGAVRVAIHRLKQRYGELLREEVGQTLESPAEIDDELKYLLGALSGEAK